MRVSKDFVLREIAGEFMLVPVGAAASRLNGLIALNECGGKIFKALEQERTREDLVQVVCAEYDVDAETAAADVEEFLGQLTSIDALVEQN